MNSSSFTPTDSQPSPCEGFQQEISEAWDEKRPHSRQTSEHLNACVACSEFFALCRMETHMRSVPAVEPALSARCLASALSPTSAVLPGVKPAASRLSTGLAKAAALAAFVSLSWWLLDPQTRPTQPASLALGASLPLGEIQNPAAGISSRLTQADAALIREQHALSDSFFNGLAHVQKVLLISHSVLP